MSKLSELIKKYSNHPDFLGSDILDVNQKGAIDDTMLHISSRRNLTDEILILLASGANIDIQGDLGYTPLQYACMQGNTEAVKILLEYSANTKIKNEFGQTAIDIARLSKKKNSELIISLLENNVRRKKIKI